MFCKCEPKLRAGSYIDRKSTRLNSSHVSISYAVFCLKKKNKAILTQSRQNCTNGDAPGVAPTLAPHPLGPRCADRRRSDSRSSYSSALSTLPTSLDYT